MICYSLGTGFHDILYQTQMIISTTTQTFQYDFLWLNPISISVINYSRAEMVECSGLKQCWFRAGRRYDGW